MKTLKFLLAFALALPALASAQGKLNVMTTVQDLAAIARESGFQRNVASTPNSWVVKRPSSTSRTIPAGLCPYEYDAPRSRLVDSVMSW